MILILLILGPAALFAAIAWLTRQRHQSLAMTAWLGVLLIGAGVPVLLGQLTALALTDYAIARSEACIGECVSAGSLLLLPLVAGLCGGLGWLAGVIAARVSGSSAD